MKLHKKIFVLILVSVLTTNIQLYSQVRSGSETTELSLSLAIEKALENNYGIIISDFDTEVAGINNSWGQAGRYPTIDLSLSSANNLNINSSSTSGINRLTGGAGVRWVLFNGFKVSLTKEKLETLNELAQGRSAIVVENTIQDIIQAYYTALLQSERQKVYQKVMEVSKDRYDAEENLKEYGGAVTYQVLQAKNSFLSDQYQYLNQEILVKVSIRNLNYLMAEDSDNMWLLSDPFEHKSESFAASDLISKVKSSNNTLQNQYINLQVAKSNLSLAMANFFPSLSFSSGVDNTLSNQFLLTQGNEVSNGLTPYANLTLSYNLYSGGSRKRAQQIAEIGEEIAETEISEMEHLVTNQILNELDAYRIRKVQLDVATESLEAAEMNLEIAAEKLRSGSINSFNYRDIQLVYLNTAIQKLQAIYALIQSHTNLTRLTGGFVSEK